MKITPSQLTIAQLLSSKNEQFFIPAYQRRYAWGNKQLVELFEDINLLDKNDSHFLGTILLLTESHTPSINTLEVVDGQQRIISLSLLLEAIRDRFVELSQQEIVQEIEGFSYCQGLDRKKQNKIILGDLDEPDYSKVLKLKNEKDLSNESDIKNKKILNAYLEFKKWINKFSFEQLNEYYFKLINNTIVVRLDTEKAKDAYKLFETINNRGLRLSPTDIIKNFLLGHASMISEDVLKDVRESWKSVIVNLDGIETDVFFRQYLMGILQRKVTFSKLISEFKKYYLTTVKEAECLSEYRLYNDFSEYDNGEEDNISETDGSNMLVENLEKEHPKKFKKVTIITFANALKDAANTYRKIITRSFLDKDVNRHIHNLQRIESTPAFTFLLSLFQQSIDQKLMIKVLKLIEAFMLRRHLSEYRTAELDDIFSKLTDINRTDILAEIKSRLTKHFPKNGEFETKFALHSFKGSRERAKYVLEQFEYELIGDQGEYTINSGNEVHLEHIIPQTIHTKKARKEYGDWVNYLGSGATEKHQQYVDRVGNYTLLGQKLNIKASNNPFRAKKKEYKKSNIRLTQNIVANYLRFKFKHVEERSGEFAKIAVKIWSL
ncbi:MAG: DUF262 domain-containing HNH endonuclease family protein [Candidatus Saelkia tenebricola]|nr:DUF262 domain-containing HNH endonuclease family protein [Candidatus Saelkia tenebricola]